MSAEETVTPPSSRKARRKKAPAGRGFYAGNFTQAELANLQTLEADLRDEIDGLRVASRRIFELSQELDRPKEAIQALSQYGASVMRIAQLLKLHSQLKGPEDPAMQAINEAISQVLKEKGWKESL